MPAPKPVSADVVDFAHEDLTVTAGTKVTWTNISSAPHTSTSGAPGNKTDIWDSPTLRANDQFSFTFNEMGTFKYYCRFHSSMKATVIVLAAGSAIPKTAPVVSASTPVSSYEY